MKHVAVLKRERRILVAYASHFGTTGDVAKAIGKALQDQGALVETKAIEAVQDLSDYDAVIVGSAIRYDKWMPQAIKLVGQHEEALGKVPVAFFFTCLALSVRNAKARRQGQAYADSLSASFSQVTPVSVGGFAGVLDYTKLSMLTRLAAKIAFAFLGVKEGDHREWATIKAWAQNIGPKLLT